MKTKVKGRSKVLHIEASRRFGRRKSRPFEGLGRGSVVSIWTLRKKGIITSGNRAAWIFGSQRKGWGNRYINNLSGKGKIISGLSFLEHAEPKG